MGCIFAEIMLGRPLFPGKNIAHQMELITDITGTPPPQTLAKIRNDRTRRYLASMGFKPKANLRRLFPRADRDALVLLEQMLSFDPDLRPTAEEALNDPYFDNLRDPAREPLSDPVSKLDFAFENQTLSAQDARNLIYEEILEYHPRVKEDYLKNRQSSFANPSAIDAFKRQFMRLEQLGSGDGPMDSKVGRTISLQRRALQNSVSLPKQASVSSSFFNPIRGGGGGDGGCSSIKSPADARQKKNATVYAEAEGGAWDGEIIEAADDDNRSNCIDGRSSWSPSLDTRYPTSLGQSRQESAEDAKPDETVAPIMSPPWPQPISSVSGPSGSSTLAQRFSTPGLVDLPPFSPGTLSLWGPSAAAAVAECQALALAAGSTCEAATPPPSATATNNNGNGLAFHGLSDSYAFVPQAVASTASPGRIRGHSTSGSSSPLRKGRRSVSGMRKSFLARNVAEVGLQTKEVVGAEIIQK